MTDFGEFFASDGGSPVKGSGLVYPKSDFGVWASPKAVTDLLGNPLVTVDSNARGVIPRFRTGDTERSVYWKSGDFVCEIISASGIADDLQTLTLGLASAVAAAEAAEAAAEAAAGGGGGLPSGGVTGDTIVKLSPAEGDATWQAPGVASLPAGYPETWPTESPWPTPAHAHNVNDLRRTVSGASAVLSNVVLALLGANDMQSARAAIGAGTSSQVLTIGTQAGQVAEGNHLHTQYKTEQEVIDLIALYGGSGGGGAAIYPWIYANGAWPALPTLDPVITKLILAFGPVPAPGAQAPAGIVVRQIVDPTLA